MSRPKGGNGSDHIGLDRIKLFHPIAYIGSDRIKLFYPIAYIGSDQAFSSDSLYRIGSVDSDPIRNPIRVTSSHAMLSEELSSILHLHCTA